MDALKSLLKLPHWVIILILGAFLVAAPCVTIDKDYHWSPHGPSTYMLVAVGLGLLVLSVLSFVYSVWIKHKSDEEKGAGLDLTRVKESNGEMWTTVSGCEIRVINGRLQDYTPDVETVIVLPCNEYFDDRCAGDTNSALGAYVNHSFDGQVEDFISLMTDECKRKLGPGVAQQKTQSESAESFGAGRCILLLSPLRRSVKLALISTTTQRAGQGLACRISHLFDGMREMVVKLADLRLTNVAMPVLGAGHGRIDPSLAFVGLLLAVAEAARYGQGGQRLRKVTIIVFKPHAGAPAEVNPIVVRRALALVGSRD